MKKIALFVSIVLVSSTFSQLNFDWVKGSSGNAGRFYYDLALDNNNCNVGVGLFYDTMITPTASGVETFFAGISCDGFITKRDALGNCIWSKQLVSGNQGAVTKVTTDLQGNIYVCGYYTDVLDIDPGTAVVMLPFQTYTSFYILKLDPAGNYVWHKSLQGSDLRDIEFDNNNNLFVVGQFNDTIKANGNNVNGILTSTQGPAGFVLSYTPSGSFNFIKLIGNTVAYAPTTVENIAFDSQNKPTIVCLHLGPIDCDPSANVATANSTSRSATVIKLDANCNYLWHKTIGDSYIIEINDLELDSEDNVILAGYFESTIDIDPSASNYEITAAGRAGFVLKLSATGSFVYGKHYESTFCQIMV
jgi:hypothetical protein